ncbi:MAG: penicillin amidase [Thermoleophilaceae bacterium]|nr:penicillin amidase [Thermoleophilaceae bacterium]
MLLALAPAAALGSIKRAETVMPAGESGFVNDAATGAGSPHLYDQVSLFESFRWKPALFGQPGMTERPRAGVKIVRDKYGVPAVTAGNDADAWWGVGYAAAQDRLTELELFRRQATGHLAEILGEGSLAGDITTRRDYHTGAQLDAQVAHLPAALRKRLAAYRDGINAWIQHVREDSSALPAEFTLLGVPLRDWKVRDSAAIGVLLVRTVPSDPGREIQNALALRGLGKRKFARLVPLHVKGSPLIVPPSRGRFPSQPGRTRKDERSAFTRSAKFQDGLSLPKLPEPVQDKRGTTLGTPGGSFAVAVRRGSGAVLYNGPQLGFAMPEQLWEFEVKRPGLHVRGVTAPGAPVAAAGFNRDVSWAITSGESDDDDLYAEKLAGGPESYRYKGKVRKMACRTESFSFKTGTTTRRLCRTRHGPVEERSGGFAYARRFASSGRELRTLVGLDRVDRAASVKQVGAAMSDMTWNENFTAADGGGHIGFWHGGLLQLKPLRWDERLPYPGTGEAEWRGFLPLRQRPHVIDPARGWLANWNNQPSAAWTNGDAAPRARLDGPLSRAVFLYRLVRKLSKHPSLAGVEGLVHHTGTTAPQRPLLEGRLKAALHGSSGKGRTVLGTLVDWDGSFARQDSNRTVEPGVATWETFKAAAAKLALGRLGKGSDEVDGENAAYHFFDASNGVAFSLRTLSTGDYRKVAAITFGKLAERFGTSNPAKWREPRHLFDWIAQGVGKPPDLPYLERGTWEQLVDIR